MPSQIGYYDTLKSVAGKVFSFLATITFTGTDGKTVTVTQDTSLDEAVAMSSKAPKTETVKGDGTAGRVLRSFGLRFTPGDTPGTNINVYAQNNECFNFPSISNATNITAGGAASGSFSLSADASTIVMNITPGILGVLAVNLLIEKINSAGTVVYYIGNEITAGKDLNFYLKQHGATTNQNWLANLDANDYFDISMCVITDS